VGDVVEFVNMGIGDAVGAMRAGHRVRRAGWNDKGMWLALVGGDDWGCGIQKHPMDDREDGVMVLPSLPFVVMRTATGQLVPWLCSQTDLLANDWQVLK